MGAHDYPVNENPAAGNNPQLVIDSTSANTMFSIMKKVKFVTIVGIVFLSLLVISGFVLIVANPLQPASLFGALIYIAIGVLLLYIASKVLSGISKTKQALMRLDNNSLNEGLKDFNTVATFQYVITIIYLALIALGFFVSLISWVGHSF